MTTQDALAFTLVGLAALSLGYRLFRATLGPRAGRWLIRRGHLTLGRRLLFTSSCGSCVRALSRPIVPDSRAR
jgi:hypothetical protein